jgi:hypothetical protein
VGALDLDKLTAGLSPTRAGYRRDWDRTPRAGNCPATTRFNYLLAAASSAGTWPSTRPTRMRTLPPTTRVR